MNRMKTYLTGILTFFLFSTVTACGPTESETHPAPLPNLDFSNQTEKMTVKIDSLYSGFQNPWGMTRLANGRLPVTERKGDILIFKTDKFTGEKVTGLPAIYASGQAGLLDIITHPDHTQNG